MRKILYSALALAIIAPNLVNAQEINQPKSSTQRIAAAKHRHNLTFSDIGKDYTDFKNMLSKDYNLSYSLDLSYMPQYGAPSGKQTSFQSMAYFAASWQAFSNNYGTGTFNFAYNAVRYAGRSGQTLANRIGVASTQNDYTTPQNTLDEFSYTHQMAGDWNWLSVTFGQFPMYNFDGSQYDSNQQENFINYSLSQNATSTYPTASLGAYAGIAPNNEWNFTFGAQDATNIDGYSIHTHLGEKRYTTFAGLTYTPTIKNLGAGYYSVLVYNQPSVQEQPTSTTGWSVNLSQQFGEKLNLFGRVNGVNKNVAFAKMSYVLGGVYNNPLNRNPLDQIGLAAAMNKINKTVVGNPQASDYETVLEAYWAWGVSKWMTLTPDVQFYINPAANTKDDYATVVSLRASVFF